MRSSAKGYAPDNGRCSAEKSPCTDSVPHNDLPVGSNRFANRNPSAFELHRKSSVSLLVSIGVVLMPLPRTGNDLLQTIMHRIPAQHTLCLSLDATSLAGSPARRGVSTAGMGCPVTLRAVSITSRTEYPIPFPRLKILLSPPCIRYCTARMCACAKSVTWM